MERECDQKQPAQGKELSPQSSVALLSTIGFAGSVTIPKRLVEGVTHGRGRHEIRTVED